VAFVVLVATAFCPNFKVYRNLGMLVQTSDLRGKVSTSLNLQQSSADKC